MIDYTVEQNENDIFCLQIVIDNKVIDEINNEDESMLYIIGNIAIDYYNKGRLNTIKKIRDDIVISSNSYMEINK